MELLIYTWHILYIEDGHILSGSARAITLEHAVEKFSNENAIEPELIISGTRGSV